MDIQQIKNLSLTVQEKFYDDVIGKAKDFMQIPENIEIDRNSLATALAYLGEINYMINTRQEIAEMGLPLPLNKAGEPNFELETLDQREINNLRKDLRKIFTQEEQRELVQIELNKSLFTDNQEYGYQLAGTYLDLVISGFIDQEEEQIVQRMEQSLSESRRLSFLNFVCPENDFAYLNGDFPEGYLRTSTTRSLLSRQMPGYRKLAEIMKSNSVDSSVLTLIGDDDSVYLSPYFTFPDVIVTNGVIRTSTNENRTKLLENIRDLLDGRTRKVKESLFSELEVVSLGNTNYQSLQYDLWELFDQISENPKIKDAQGNKLFSEEDIQLEIQRMSNLFSNFYADLVKIKGRFPTDSELVQIISRKFAIYSIQGLFAYTRSPNLILIQTEQPRNLRNKMVNGGLRLLGLPEIPSIRLSI